MHAGDGLVIQDQQKQPLVGQNRRSPRFRPPTALIVARVLRGSAGAPVTYALSLPTLGLLRVVDWRFLSALKSSCPITEVACNFGTRTGLNRTSEALNYPSIGAQGLGSFACGRTPTLLRGFKHSSFPPLTTGVACSF